MLVREVQLLTAVIAAPTNSAAVQPWTEKLTFTAEGSTSAGTGAATIVCEGKAEGADIWQELGTITLTLGVTETADGFTVDAPWRQVRMRVSAISGTDATVDGWMLSKGAH